MKSARFELAHNVIQTMYNRAGWAPERWWRMWMLLSIDERIAHLEGRSLRGEMHDVRRQVEQFDARASARLDHLAARLDGLDDKISRQFTWMVGIQVAVLVAIVGAVLRGVS